MLLDEGIRAIALNLAALKLLRILSIPWKKQKAYKCGIIDEKGNRIKDNKVPARCKKDYTLLHRVAFNLKRLLNKVPGIGKKTITSYIAALALLKEDIDDPDDLKDLEALSELFMVIDNNNDGYYDISLLQEESIAHVADESNQSAVSVFLLDEAAATTVSTTAVGNLNIPPVVGRPRKISLFDIDDDDGQFDKVRMGHRRKKRDRWDSLIDPDMVHSNKIKRAWRRGDLVFLRNGHTGDIRAIAPNIKKEHNEQETAAEEERRPMKSFKEIRSLLEDVEKTEAIILEQEINEMYEQHEDLFEALDELHSMDFDDINEVDDAVNELSEKYGIDDVELFQEYYDEMIQTEGIGSEMLGLDKMKDIFKDYKKALAAMDKLVKKERAKKNGDMKSLEFYAQKVDNMIQGKFNPKKLAALYRKEYAVSEETEPNNKAATTMVNEKLDPSDDAEVWIKDFIKSDNPRFSGKTKEERKEMALAAWYDARRKAGISEGNGDHHLAEKVTQKEIDKLMVDLMDMDIADDLIDAIEDEDEKKMVEIISMKVDDKKKAKEIVKKVMELSD